MVRLLLAGLLLVIVQAVLPAQASPTARIYLPLARGGDGLMAPPPPSEATATPTPTVTPTPTLTPVPTTPTPAVAIRPNHFAYQDYSDYVHVLGEVQNVSTLYLRFVRVAADVFNRDGKLVGAGYVYTPQADLPPGGRACFDIMIRDPGAWASYRFEGVGWSPSPQGLPRLTQSNASSSYDSTLHWYRVLGMVRNDELVTVRFVQPTVTLYNAAGTVVGCAFGYVGSLDLAPGQSSAFDLSLGGRDYVDVTSYSVTVDGLLPWSVGIEPTGR